MPKDDELKDKTGKVLQALSINLRTKAARSALTLSEFIETQLASGVSQESLETILLQDLNEGGRIFGEFFNSIGADIKGRLGEVANVTAKVEFGTDPQKKKVWIAALVNTCPDCLPRHGQVDTEENWELRGEPRTGWSICRTNCQCQLLDAEDVEGREELKNPIQRQRRN